MADIQWVGPNGTVLKDPCACICDPLTQSFTMVTMVITHGDFPGVTTTLLNTLLLRHKYLDGSAVYLCI